MCVGVSGIDDSSLLIGRPFGGCAILYRKSLSSCVTPLETCSDRFCALKLLDLSGSTTLMISVYMPAECAPSHFSDYLNTLGEIEGFIDSQQCDNIVLAGDFNVDFDRGGSLADILLDFISDLDLVASDLSYRNSVGFTYERDDGLARSWIDHIICSQVLSPSMTNVHTLKSGTNLSDHLPLCFNFDIQCPTITAASISSKPTSIDWPIDSQTHISSYKNPAVQHPSPTSIPTPSQPSPQVPTPCSNKNSTSRPMCIDWSKATPSQITSYQDMVSEQLSDPPANLLCCSQPDCSIHDSLLDGYADHIMNTLLDCALRCLPCRTISPRKIVGWNDSTGKLKKASVFWHKVWEEAGCPTSGVLSAIKRHAKKRYKYEIRRLKRRKQFLLRDRLARSFARKKKDSFWSDIKRLNNPGVAQCSPVVDSVSGTTNIANIFASKFGALLNKHSSSQYSLLTSVQASLTVSHLSSVIVSEDDISDAISQLKTHKSDAFGVTTEHLKFALPVITKHLSSFLTSILRHGYMPQSFRDSVLVPVPKGNKDASNSSNYRPIALSSTFSKIIERSILINYESFFSTSPLQFGFKPGHSTSLCTATVKNVISRYLHNGSPVLGCFLDASKAFDLVDHDILFKTLLGRGLPLPIVRFLLSWYGTQKMRVRWDSSFSESFSVCNGVRQGSILSPFLFAVYIDGLLNDLNSCGVGCYWGCSFAGAFSYADDVVLLAPCASAMRIMLEVCRSFAVSHKLEFNASKTQLICFYAPSVAPITPSIYFNSTLLSYSNQVVHLGHILTNNLNDTMDIMRVVKDLNRKANFVLCTFHAADPFVKTFLLQSYCLSLYGCCLWSLNSPSISLIEIALNKNITQDLAPSSSFSYCYRSLCSTG